MEYPKLRFIQFFPVLIEGKRMGCLHDPQRISDKSLLIPWHLVSILPYLDGTHSLLNIQAKYTKQSGDLLFREDLIKFLEQLDYYLYLDSKRFCEFEEKVKQKFLCSPIRPAFFSGLSYSSDPRILREELTGFFTSSNGPGLPKCNFKTYNKVTGIVAPHIDLKLGGTCYSWAYHELLQSSILPELFIILGTCHTEIESLFSLTNKDFQTPLGIVKCDKDFINLLQENSSYNLCSNEFYHRSEHTIEFQILFLQFLWERVGTDAPPLKICPILCAFSPDNLEKRLDNNVTYNILIDSLKKLLSSYKKSICIIASVDLAHIGPKFGDPSALDQFERQSCFTEDNIMLNIIAQQDKKKFQKYMLSNFHKRRICGYSPLAILLDILPSSKGRLLCYNHSIVDEQESIVTYASMAFYKK